MTSVAAPLLSVVMPVYRVADYLPACLDSILAEAGEGVEVVRGAAAGLARGRPAAAAARPRSG